MTRRNRQLLLLDALRAHEAAGRPFALDDLVADTGYKLSTLRTYHTKRLRGVFLFDADDGRLEARGLLNISEEAFLRRLDQTRAAPTEDQTRVAALCARSQEHLELALTLYHRPSLSARVAAFCHHMLTAWELLLTAEIAAEGVSALEALDRGQLGERRKHLLSRGLGPEDAPIRANLDALARIRALPPHLPLESLQAPLSRLFQACVLNYGARYEHLTGAVLPMGGLSALLIEGRAPALDALEATYGEHAVETLKGLLREVRAQTRAHDSARFAVPAGYQWQLVLAGDDAELAPAERGHDAEDPLEDDRIPDDLNADARPARVTPPYGSPSLHAEERDAQTQGDDPGDAAFVVEGAQPEAAAPRSPDMLTRATDLSPDDAHQGRLPLSGAMPSRSDSSSPLSPSVEASPATFAPDAGDVDEDAAPPDRGPEAEVLRASTQEAPSASLAELIKRARRDLSPRFGRVLVHRVETGKSLESLAATFTLEPDEVRRMLAQAVSSLRARFGADAVRLSAPLRRELRESGGVVHQSLVSALTDIDDLRWVRLGLVLAGEYRVGVWQGEFLNALPAPELARRLTLLGDELRSQPQARLPVARARALTAAVTGLDLPREGFSQLMTVAFAMTLGDDQRLVVRRTLADRLLRLMEDAEAPLHFVDIVARYRADYPDMGDAAASEIVGAQGETPRELEAALAAMLRGHEDIYSLGHESFVHVSALPVTPLRLEETVAWCVEFMEGLDGPISPQRLLGELDRVGKERSGLTAALLHDGLARHSDVVAFQNVRAVAHVDSFREQGLTLEEWIEHLLLSHEDPLTLAELMAQLPDGVHFHRTAVHALLLTSPWAIALGRGRFEHIDRIGLEGPTRRRLVDTAVAMLPEDGSPTSCKALLRALSPTSPPLQASGPERALAILWGLLHKDERAQCGPGGRVARSRDEGAHHLLEAAIVEVLMDLDVAHIRQLRLELSVRYGHGGMASAFRALLLDCVEAGIITELPGRRYTLA